MSDSPVCPRCKSEYPYQDGYLWVCPECAHEWNAEDLAEANDDVSDVVLDANGNQLQDGDTVALVKTLKVKGASSPLRAGTKVKNIRIDPHSRDGHNIDCRIDGFGALALKSEFVKKV